MNTEHLSPEIFVDVLEGVPVDASWRLHLESCESCQAELAELKETLTLLNHDGVAAAPTRRTFPTWVLTAAAMLAAAVGLSLLVGERGPHTPTSVELEELLPPVEDDAEFQLLQALSDASDVELAELAELAQALDGVALDPSPLTPGERQRFVERLTEEMRSSL